MRGVESNHGVIRSAELPAPLSRPFSAKDGGTYLKGEGAYVTTEGMLQYDPSGGGWDFLKISW